MLWMILLKKSHICRQEMQLNFDAGFHFFSRIYYFSFKFL